MQILNLILFWIIFEEEKPFDSNMYVIIIFKIQDVNLSINISLNSIEISAATLSNDLSAMTSWGFQWKLIFDLD